MADPIVQGFQFKGTNEDELKTIIHRELDTALGTENGQLSIERQQSLRYYLGETFGNEVEGRSQVVMRTVLEVIEWVLPALLRIFTASDKIANIEPVREQEEQAADQATEYVSHIFYRDNPGFMILHDWFKDALLSKVGWVKRYWEDQDRQEFDSYTGLTQQEYDALKQGERVEVVEERSYVNPQPGYTEDNPDPQAAGQTLYDCTLKVTRTEGREVIVNVPPEEVLTSRRAKRGDMPYLCHRRERRFSDLVEDGYDIEALRLVPTFDAPEWNAERLQRFQPDDDWPYNNERTDEAMREIWVEESYVRADVDGDGIAELLKVVTSGNGSVILTKKGKPDIEPLDEVPLYPLCPVPLPHKLFGMSLADLVQDLQLIKSVIFRQMLDNLYLTNNPRHYVDETKTDERTIDDLLTSRPGGIVRGKGENGVVPLLTPFVAEKSMPIIEYLDQTSEVRSGVGRHNQAVTTDILNKSSSGYQEAMLQQAAAQRVELIARIFAEGVRDLIKGILGSVRKHQQQERIIRVTGEWLTMDPRQWRNDMEVTVSVGLGTGNKDQILAHLEKLLQAQAQIVAQQGGLNGPLVYAKNVFDTLELATESMGLKQSLFTDPTQPPPPGSQPQGQQPNPEAMKAQGQLQIEQMKAQQQAALAQAQSQAELQEQQARLQADLAAMQQKAELQAKIDVMRASQQMQLEREHAQHEIELEQTRSAAKLELEKQEIAMRAAAGAYTSGPAPRAGA